MASPDLTSSEEEAARALANSFALDPSRMRVLHRGEGIVLQAPGRSGAVILKMRQVSESDMPRLEARLAWIAYLHRHGVRVPELVASRGGIPLERVTVAGTLYAAHAYRAMPLTPESRIDWRDPSMPQKLGVVTGRMHRLAKGYEPEPGEPRMGHWFEADWVARPHEVLHRSQAIIAERIVALRDILMRVPVNVETYGLVHDDLHTGNVFHLGDDLAVIDFGCCHYAWFAADIASAMVFRTWIEEAKEQPEVVIGALRFLRGVAKGYASECDLPTGWLDLLPSLLKLREISLFQSYYRGQSHDQAMDEPRYAYLYQSIAEQRPFLDVDLSGAV